MLADLFRTRSKPREGVLPRGEPDAAYAARSRLLQLRDSLVTAIREGQQCRRRHWGEPPVFFFDRRRQTDLETARPRPAKLAANPLAERIAREVGALCESVDVRRAARAISGLREAAESLPYARELAALLAIPDDETVLILHPARRLGFRLLVRGIADANQFQVLMLDAIASEVGLTPLPSRFAAACREANPVVPAGVPMALELPFQLLRPSSVRSDGTVPEGFRGCDHWLWGWEPLAALPRVDGERTVVLGESAFSRTWEVERCFPALAAEMELLDVLSPFQVAERLGRLAGQPMPVRVRERHEERLAEAA